MIYVSIDGFQAGDMFFSLLLFFIVAIVMFILIIRRSKSRTQNQLDRVEQKLDKLLNETNDKSS
ncbi:hypothetical protein [Gracilibacillus kekensis]|uniref:DUF4083 domain-containing protein n=1 Tax=Gracilibacillus kekensis TaxID=1027249 RepID=A0A1M7KDI8_9BACI|nr:hypothetical protein [Gracilibacillus kekensis]SHM63334.1 hypothetical protein SAMN05216179_0663 [Gracilibacillus kekensis]